MTTAEAREAVEREMEATTPLPVEYHRYTLDALIAAVRAEERASIVKALREFANTGDDPRVMLERHITGDFVEKMK